MIADSFSIKINTGDIILCTSDFTTYLVSCVSCKRDIDYHNNQRVSQERSDEQRKEDFNIH